MESPLLWIGLLLLAGFGSEFLADRAGLPGVSLFILTGALLGMLGILPDGFVEQSDVVVDLGLAIIGFLIGGSLQWDRLKRLGNVVWRILFSEFYGATMSVTATIFAIAFWFDSFSWTGALALALILGSISAATATAATLAVVHEQRARGPLTTVILSIVAADDGLALITYSVAISVAGMLLGQGTSLQVSLLAAGYEILSSVLIGIGGAVFLKIVLRRNQNGSSMLLPGFTAILLCFGLSSYLDAGGLLSCMVLGAFLVNTYHRFDTLYNAIADSFESIIFTLFFILSGLHIRWDILGAAWVLALGYFFARITGKLTGSYLAARLSNADPVIKKYTGMSLIPQAGVALGLALQTRSQISLPHGGNEILLSVVIATTTINELLGPVLTRRALILAGESHTVRLGEAKK